MLNLRNAKAWIKQTITTGEKLVQSEKWVDTQKNDVKVWKLPNQ
jgi:hypothetical protein